MLTLELLGESGDARLYRLFEPDNGYEEKFAITGAERKTDGDDGQEAIRRHVGKYRLWAESMA